MQNTVEREVEQMIDQYGERAPIEAWHTASALVYGDRKEFDFWYDVATTLQDLSK